MGTRQNDRRTKVIEQGDIYFLFRPRVEEEAPQRLEDIQRLFVVMQPRKRHYRRLVIGRKRLPEPERSGQQRFWGFVDEVSERSEEVGEALRGRDYETATQGERHQPSARPAGEGVYALVRHDGDHVHLAYTLELPRERGDVQQELNIEDEASYVMAVKNPDVPSPANVGLQPQKTPRFPAGLQKQFDGRRFTAADPPELLDQEGAEFVLISATDDVAEELGVRLDAERETRASADTFRELRIRAEEHPVEPLFRGEWEDEATS